jgi:hypothetical protein
MALQLLAARALTAPRLRTDSTVPARARLTPAVDDETPFANVLVSNDERRAFRMLIAAVASGRLPPLPANTSPDEIAAAPLIELQPLEIPPLAPLTRLDGEGE